MGGFSTDIRYHQEGRLYSTGGAVLDIDGPTLLGTFELPAWFSPVLPTKGGAYYLEDEQRSTSTSYWHAAVLTRYTNSNYAKDARYTLLLSEDSFDFKDISRWGDSGIAVLEAGRIIFARNAFK